MAEIFESLLGRQPCLIPALSVYVEKNVIKGTLIGSFNQTHITMNIFQSIMLAVVQGLTEFLPVSSSGHLVLFQNLFGLKEPEILFDICLHIGTLFAIFVVFFKDIRSIILSAIKFPYLLRSAGGMKNLYSENADIKMLVLIVVGSIPTGILGILFHKVANQIFSSVLLVGIMLIVTGSFLWASRFVKEEGRDIQQATMKDALIIGFAQGIAVIPGISRSGSTIVIGLFAGLGRETVARYSFLMSIPAILGALFLEIIGSDVPTNIPIGIILTGVAVAAIVGYGALKILLNMVKQRQLYIFAPYCWAVGIVVLVIS